MRYFEHLFSFIIYSLFVAILIANQLFSLNLSRTLIKIDAMTASP